MGGITGPMPPEFSTRDLLQFVEQNRVLGLVTDIVNIDIANNALFIDYENSAFGHSFVAKDVVIQSDEAVRPEIAQQRI